MNKKRIILGIIAVVLIAIAGGGIFVWTRYGSVIQDNKSSNILLPTPKQTTLQLPTEPTLKGAGGCTSAESCIKYCIDPSHIAECAEFGDAE